MKIKKGHLEYETVPKNTSFEDTNLNHEDTLSYT